MAFWIFLNKSWTNNINLIKKLILKLYATFSPTIPMILFGGNLNRKPTEYKTISKAILVYIAISLDEFTFETSKIKSLSCNFRSINIHNVYYILFYSCMKVKNNITFHLNWSGITRGHICNVFKYKTKCFEAFIILSVKLAFNGYLLDMNSYLINHKIFIQILSKSILWHIN